MRPGQSIRPLGAVLLSALIVACSYNTYPSAAYDRSLITSEPCAPPCWYGIQPGDTQESAVNRLRELPFVDGATIEEQNGEVSWDDVIPGKSGGGTLTFRQGELATISYQLQYPLSLMELVDIFGEPHGFDVFTSRGTRGIETILYIYWPSQGLVATVPVDIEPSEMERTAPIRPDSIVEVVAYYENQADIEAVFQELYADYPLEETMDNYYRWNGYVPLSDRMLYLQ
jgi:hypothetical protein